MSSTAIVSEHIIHNSTIIRGAILIDEGNITGIVDEIPSRYEKVIDAGSKYVMPGIIDPHVHINEPGRTEWEGFETATRAAIAGGVSTMIEMPLNASPVTTTVEAYEKKLHAAAGKLYADCGFWGGVIPGNTSELIPLARKGVKGFKAFLTHSGIDEFPNVSRKDLEEAMPIIAELGLPLLVHCEWQSVENDNPEAGRSTGNLDESEKISRSYRHYLQSRPAKWENDAIAMMIDLCRKFKCRTHIVHLSSAEALEMITKAKHEDLPLTVETAQHYLYFDAENIPDASTAYKCAPPIREKNNNEQLWQALKSGVIDFVATDHSPAPPEMKEIHSGNLMKAWGGIASIQFSLSALWTAAKKHNISVEDMAKWLAINPAKLPGLGKIKGNISKGLQADLVIWDPHETFTVQENNIFHRHKITPYLGQELYGVVHQTMLAGELVYDRTNPVILKKGKILS